MEIVQIVDRDNNTTGSVPRDVMRRDGLTHRACYILVFNDSGELYLQKRTKTKDIFPSFWDVAAGGVVLAGESYDDSAKRELEEELGIKDTHLTFQFDHYHETANNKVWGRVYTCKHNGPFTLQDEEIEYGCFMAPKEILSLDAREPATPDGLEILRKLLQGNKQPVYFLHGLESSGRGTKGRFFEKDFKEIISPDFSGSLEQRLEQLKSMVGERKNLTFIGSSFGGLMATCFAQKFPDQVEHIVLLAPALNFEGYEPPKQPSTIKTTLYIGHADTVCPPDIVLPLAEKSYSNLTSHLVDDDHMLHNTFQKIDWKNLLYTRR